jgi:integrase
VDRDETEKLARDLESHKGRTLRNSLRDYKAYLARSMLYRTALNTGFRSQELGSLTPAQVTSGGVILLSTDAKNRTYTVQPILATFLGELSKYVASRPANERIWPGSRWRKAAVMARSDCLSAPDFHSLRVTYITELVRRGLHPKKAQILARHSTMELTMKFYVKLSGAELDVEHLF